MFGIMMTTWHLLKSEIYSILGCAKVFGAHTFNWSQCNNGYNDVALCTKTATLLRMISFEGNAYEKSGWTKNK